MDASYSAVEEKCKRFEAQGLKSAQQSGKQSCTILNNTHILRVKTGEK